MIEVLRKQMTSNPTFQVVFDRPNYKLSVINEKKYDSLRVRWLTTPSEAGKMGYSYFTGYFMTKLLQAGVLALGIALSGAFVSYAIIETRKPDRTVQVKGLAEKLVKADQAIWTLNFKVVNNELSGLYKDLKNTQNAMTKFLHTQGFPKNTIHFNPVTVVDNQSSSYNQNPSLPRFSADAGLTVSTPDIDRVTESAQKTGTLVEQGVVLTLSNAIYRYNALNTIKPQMLIDATANAREAADSFANNAGTELGGIRKAIQGLFSIRDANSNYDSGAAVMKKVRVVTTIEYALKQ